MCVKWWASYKKQELLPLGEHIVILVFFCGVRVAHVLAICIVLFLVCALCAQCLCGLWSNVVCVLWPNVATVTGLAILNCSSSVL